MPLHENPLHTLVRGLEAPINSPAEANPQVLNKPLTLFLNDSYCWT